MIKNEKTKVKAVARTAATTAPARFPRKPLSNLRTVLFFHSLRLGDHLRKMVDTLPHGISVGTDELVATTRDVLVGVCLRLSHRRAHAADQLLCLRGPTPHYTQAMPNSKFQN